MKEEMKPKSSPKKGIPPTTWGKNKKVEEKTKPSANQDTPSSSLSSSLVSQNSSAPIEANVASVAPPSSALSAAFEPKKNEKPLEDNKTNNAKAEILPPKSTKKSQKTATSIAQTRPPSPQPPFVSDLITPKDKAEKAEPVAKVAPSEIKINPATSAESAPPPASAKKIALPPTTQEDPLAIPIDAEKFAQVSSEFFAETGKASSALFRNYKEKEGEPVISAEQNDMAKVFGLIAESWMKDPTRLIEKQKSISLDLINLWSAAVQQFTGEPSPAVVNMPARDQRFADSEWNENPYFSFLKQAYFLGTHWANRFVDETDDIDESTRLKAGFYVRQLAGALSPSNFVLTNPELLRMTVKEQGGNLARGMKMFAEDVEAGNGGLKIRQSDNTAFEVGRDLALTPGKVVYRNELIELIHYKPVTETNFTTPLVIAPPWINKFYILDLNPEKSFVRWAVEQGVSVFIISWINPDESLRSYDFGAYIQRGILEAVTAAKTITGAPSVNTIGYCVGGTLLSSTLAYLAKEGQQEIIRSATLFTTQVDFTYAGDLLAFVDEEQIRAIEDIMAKHGYLPGDKMANAFNMLRPNDLIWSYMVNNYLRGKKPAPFDLLYWNSDSTRMAEANHSFYLRNCYLNNALSKGEMTVLGHKLDLKEVKVPIYNLAAREDHIAPAKSVFFGSSFFGGDVTYVLAGSGHIAGVVNPVAKPKYQYWTGQKPTGTYEDWVQEAKETPGTWWPHWLEWLTKGETRVPARQPGEHPLYPALDDAPGRYVKIK